MATSIIETIQNDADTAIRQYVTKALNEALGEKKNRIIHIEQIDHKDKIVSFSIEEVEDDHVNVSLTNTQFFEFFDMIQDGDELRIKAVKNIKLYKKDFS